MALIAGTSFFLLVFFLISLLDVDFLKKENRLHGYLCFFFFIDLSQSHDLACGFGGLTWVDSHLFGFQLLFLCD
jgi:hypothetical protein